MFSEITKVNSPPPADMDGKNIGSLLFRDYDDAMVSISGGKSVQNNDSLSYSNSYFDYLNLVKKLQNKEIDGFVLDRFTVISALWTNFHALMGKMDEKWKSAFPFSGTFLQNLKARMDYTNMLFSVRIAPPKSKTYAYGILVKSQEDYAYLKSAAEDLGQTITRNWNNDYFDLISKHVLPDVDLNLYSAGQELYSYKGWYFKSTMVAVAIMVVLICVYGTVYESLRKGKYRR